MFRIRNKEFQKDTEAMLKVLIDQHPAGWSTVVERRFDDMTGDADPQCFCHGGRHEPGWLVTQGNAADSGAEYAYAFDESKMLVLASYCRSGAKMVGMFGAGAPDAVWSVIATVDLDGPEPDWQTMEMLALQY